jgi:hypothetical protein
MASSNMALHRASKPQTGLHARWLAESGFPSLEPELVCRGQRIPMEAPETARADAMQE